MALTNFLLDDDGGLGNTLQLRHGDVTLHVRGQHIMFPFYPVTVRGKEQSFRSTVVILALERSGNIYHCSASRTMINFHSRRAVEDPHVGSRRCNQ
jgi:hypothetical protein